MYRHIPRFESFENVKSVGWFFDNVKSCFRIPRKKRKVSHDFAAEFATYAYTMKIPKQSKYVALTCPLTHTSIGQTMWDFPLFSGTIFYRNLFFYKKKTLASDTNPHRGSRLATKSYSFYNQDFLQLSCSSFWSFNSPKRSVNKSTLYLRDIWWTVLSFRQISRRCSGNLLRTIAIWKRQPPMETTAQIHSSILNHVFFRSSIWHFERDTQKSLKHWNMIFFTSVFLLNNNLNHLTKYTKLLYVRILIYDIFTHFPISIILVS